MSFLKKSLVLMLCLGLVLAGCGKTAPSSATVTESTEDELATEVVTETVTEEETTTEAVSTEEMTMEEDATTEEATTDVDETEESTEPEFKTEVTEEITVFPEVKTMYPTIALNVRFGPSTEYQVISSVRAGQGVEVTGQAETGWYQVNIGKVGYVSNKYMSESTPAPAPATPAQPAPDGSQPAPAPAPAAAPAGVIMVGDSRFVQMQEAVGGGGVSWVCENSKGYKWLAETAIPRIDPSVGRGTKVVINLGVNDTKHANDYINLVNAKAAEWGARGARVYYVSVNPVWENPYVTQEQVDLFNQTVAPSLSGVRWIDTSSWLQANGYRLVDGLHYDAPTSVNIFNLIMGSL